MVQRWTPDCAGVTKVGFHYYKWAAVSMTEVRVFTSSERPLDGEVEDIVSSWSLLISSIKSIISGIWDYSLYILSSLVHAKKRNPNL
jgi:hypothetical protein